jgi:hypothetical protein
MSGPFLAAGLVAVCGVENELSEELSGVGVDDADTGGRRKAVYSRGSTSPDS